MQREELDLSRIIIGYWIDKTIQFDENQRRCQVLARDIATYSLTNNSCDLGKFLRSLSWRAMHSFYLSIQILILGEHFDIFFLFVFVFFFNDLAKV